MHKPLRHDTLILATGHSLMKTGIPGLGEGLIQVLLSPFLKRLHIAAVRVVLLLVPEI